MTNDKKGSDNKQKEKTELEKRKERKKKKKEDNTLKFPAEIYLLLKSGSYPEVRKCVYVDICKIYVDAGGIGYNIFLDLKADFGFTVRINEKAPPISFYKEYVDACDAFIGDCQKRKKDLDSAIAQVLKRLDQLEKEGNDNKIEEEEEG